MISAHSPAWARHVSTLLGIGYLKPAPGTWGSAAAVPLAWLIHWAGGFPLLALASVAVFGLGTLAIGRLDGAKDPAEVVIDEVAGQWVALLPLSAGLWMAGSLPYVFPWPGWLGAFLLFRLFDIWKPGPVGWADRKEGPVWVMLDDVLAGIAAALITTAAAAVAHGWLM